MIHVYVAGPYTGDEEANVLRMLAAATELRDAGLAPFVPLLSHYWEQHHPAPYETWMALDLAWIERCDVFLRIPGESSGATREEEHARRLGMQPFRSAAEVIAWARRAT